MILKNPNIQLLADDVEEKEYLGYSFDSPEGSFELLARRFDVKGRFVVESDAPATVEVGQHCVRGVVVVNGSVNALDMPIHKTLTEYYPDLRRECLIDHKVRMVSPSDRGNRTDAVTWVLIESGNNEVLWTTIGGSASIINDYTNALSNVLTYKLMKGGAVDVGNAAIVRV